jgi:hypothetical protein
MERLYPQGSVHIFRDFINDARTDGYGPCIVPRVVRVAAGYLRSAGSTDLAIRRSRGRDGMGGKSLKLFHPPFKFLESVYDRTRQGETQFVGLRSGERCRGLDLKLGFRRLATCRETGPWRNAGQSRWDTGR